MRAVLYWLMLAAAALPAAAETSPEHAGGERLFARHCAMCHDAGDGHPGTMRLATRLGAPRSVLTSRDDLTRAYIAGIVRHGLQMMPPFRPTEITDGELATLAAWLAAGADPTPESRP